MRKASLIVAGAASLGFLLLVWPTLYTYRSDKTAPQGFARINRLTQDVQVLSKGEWEPLAKIEARQRQIDERWKIEQRMTAAELGQLEFEPEILWPSPGARLKFRLYNGTSRPLHAIRVTVTIDGRPYRQLFFQTFDLRSRSWGEGAIYLFDLPERLDGSGWSATIDEANAKMTGLDDLALNLWADDHGY